MITAVPSVLFKVTPPYLDSQRFLLSVILEHSLEQVLGTFEVRDLSHALTIGGRYGYFMFFSIFPTAPSLKYFFKTGYNYKILTKVAIKFFKL